MLFRGALLLAGLFGFCPYSQIAPRAKEELLDLSEVALLPSTYGALLAQGSSSSDNVKKTTVVPRSNSSQPPLDRCTASTGDVTAQPGNALVVFGPPLPSLLLGNAETESGKVRAGAFKYLTPSS